MVAMGQLAVSKAKKLLTKGLIVIVAEKTQKSEMMIAVSDF
jgi:hypothetical protein